MEEILLTILKSSDPFHFLQNDISDVVGVFFSVDADEEKHILYEKTEVFHLLSMQETIFLCKQEFNSLVPLCIR